MLGLYDEKNGHAGRVLREFDVQRETILSLSEDQETEDKPDRLSRNSQSVLENAQTETIHLGTSTIGTGALLLGILRLDILDLAPVFKTQKHKLHVIKTHIREVVAKNRIPFDEQMRLSPLDAIIHKIPALNILRLRRQSPAMDAAPSPDDMNGYRRSVVEVLTDLTREYSDYTAAKVELALYQYLLRDYSSSVDSLSTAIENDPTNNDAVRLRAVINHQIKDFEGALIDCTTYLSFKPEDGWVYYIRGETYRGLGQRDLAVADFHKALERADTVDVKDLEKWKQDILDYIAQEEQSS